jgi:hypothetical protein
LGLYDALAGHGRGKTEDDWRQQDTEEKSRKDDATIADILQHLFAEHD